ncbi:hypothetical protein L0Y69_00550 [bacterium]|nr:hypothetical protein [bacterium]
MWKTIEKMRKQQDDVKRSVSFLASLSLTGFILISWFVFYNPGADPERKKDVDDLISPIAALKESMSAGMAEIGDNLTEAKKIAGTIAAGNTSSTTATSTESENISTTTEEI